MKLIEIKKDNNNELFERKELELIVEDVSTPSRENMVLFLAKEFSTDENNITIKGIIGKFGSNNFKVKANIYKNSEDKDKLERKKKKEIELQNKKKLNQTQNQKSSEEINKEELKDENLNNKFKE